MVVRIFIQMSFDQAKGGCRFQERRVFVANLFRTFTRGKARAGKELIQKRIETWAINDSMYKTHTVQPFGKQPISV